MPVQRAIVSSKISPDHKNLLHFTNSTMVRKKGETHTKKEIFFVADAIQ